MLKHCHLREKSKQEILVFLKTEVVGNPDLRVEEKLRTILEAPLSDEEMKALFKSAIQKIDIGLAEQLADYCQFSYKDPQDNPLSWAAIIGNKYMVGIILEAFKDEIPEKFYETAKNKAIDYGQWDAVYLLNAAIYRGVDEALEQFNNLPQFIAPNILLSWED